MACAKAKKPVTHYCHAGLVDTAVPIRYKDSILGYIMFGQIKDGSSCNAQKLKTILPIAPARMQIPYSSKHSCLVQQLFKQFIKRNKEITAIANIINKAVWKLGNKPKKKSPATIIATKVLMVSQIEQPQFLLHIKNTPVYNMRRNKKRLE